MIQNIVTPIFKLLSKHMDIIRVRLFGLASSLAIFLLAFSILLGSLGLTTAYAATPVIPDKPNQRCDDLYKASISSAFPNLAEIINPQLNLPLLPDVCTIGDANGNTTTATPNALNLKYLGFAILRVYKLIIAFTFYSFGLSIMINATFYQINIINGDSGSVSKFKGNIIKSIKGVVTVLLAYFIIQAILWLFNLSGILDSGIFNTDA